MVTYKVSSFGECVEFSQFPDGSVTARDPEDVDRHMLRTFTCAAWDILETSAKAGKFDAA